MNESILVHEVQQPEQCIRLPDYMLGSLKNHSVKFIFDFFMPSTE